MRPLPLPAVRILALVSALFFAASARADILISEFFNVSRYRDDGSLVNASFITGFGRSTGILVSGTSIYVCDSQNDRVGRYNLDGSVVNTSFITGLDEPVGLAEGGGVLFVANWEGNNVKRYVLATGAPSGTITAGINGPLGLVYSSGFLFVANFNDDSIRRYTLSGGAPNASISTGIFGPTFLGIRPGGSIMVSNFSTNSVSTFGASETSGASPFVSGITSPEGLAAIGNNIAVVSYDGNVRLYNSTGGLVNASFITGLAAPTGIAYLPVKTPHLPATVKINGRKKVVTAKSRHLIKGRSTGAISVQVKVGKANPGKAAGVFTWRYKAKLKRGKNIVIVRALNADDNPSAPARIIIRRR
jgi:hypothetical protein